MSVHHSSKASRIITGILLLATTAMVSLNLQLFRNESKPPKTKQDTAAATPILSGDIALSPYEFTAKLADFEGTLARPLFTPSRRPTLAPEPEPSPAPPPPTPKNLRLIGIIERSPATRHALIRTDDAPGAWFKNGDKISGWEVERIDSDAVVLRTGPHAHQLKLFPQHAKN